MPEIVKVKVAANGDVFALDDENNVVWKSSNGGLSWTPSLALLPADGDNYLVDLAISPSYATDHTVFALSSGDGDIAAPQVYISTSSGALFSVLGGTLGVATGPENYGTSLAVSPSYASGNGEVMAGTNLGVYIWGKDATLNWAAQNLNADVTSVAYSPNFLIDSTRLAVSSNVSGTILHTLVGDDNNSFIPAWDKTLPLGSTVDSRVTDATIVSSSMAFPSDFNASSPLARLCFVSIITDNVATGFDNVYRIGVGAGTTPTAPATSVGIAMGSPTWWTTAADAFAVQDLAYSGTYAAGTLYGACYETPNPPTGPGPLIIWNTAPMAGSTSALQSTWSSSIGGLTGSSPASLALANDFATSQKIYVATVGPEGAVSVSTGGMFFMQAGLINTAIANITDFQAASATEYYMVTTDNGAETSSLWHTTNGGLAWYRIAEDASDTCFVKLSPAYATDKTVVFGEKGGTDLFISNDNGNSWNFRTAPVDIADVAIKDQYTMYIGDYDSNGVTSTANGGWTWAFLPTPTGINDCRQVKVNVATGAILVGDAAGAVALSTNGNMSYTMLAMGAPVGTGGAVVSFDPNYATNNLIYAAGKTSAGIWRYWVGTSMNWGIFSVDGNIDRLPNSIALAKDGTLYAGDSSSANTSTTGGMVRILHPEDPFGTLTKAETVSAGLDDGFPFAATLNKLTVATGTNQVFAMVTNAGFPMIYTYTDTLSMGSTPASQVSPAAGTVLTDATMVMFSWTAVPGAQNYEIQYDYNTDWRDVGNLEVGPQAMFGDFQSGASSMFVGNTSAVATNLALGLGFNWRVRVSAPVYSPWSTTGTYTTEASVAGPHAPQNLVTDDGLALTTLTPSFQWDQIKYATGYEFQLSANSDMSAPIVDLTGANALGPVNAYKYAGAPLNNNKTYYWRVKGLTASSNTDWSSVTAFTTMDVPPVVAPPVIITSQPAVTIVNPTPTQTNITFTQPATKEINPNYIWAIIIIGAVLVLAVIVLIVRTRRPV